MGIKSKSNGAGDVLGQRHDDACGSKGAPHGRRARAATHEHGRGQHEQQPLREHAKPAAGKGTERGNGRTGGADVEATGGRDAAAEAAAAAAAAAAACAGTPAPAGTADAEQPGAAAERRRAQGGPAVSEQEHVWRCRGPPKNHRGPQRLQPSVAARASDLFSGGLPHHYC